MKLKTIILLVDDSSKIGGIPNLFRDTIGKSKQRNVNYIGISAEQKHSILSDEILVYETNKNTINALLDNADPDETVVWFSNLHLYAFPKEFIDKIKKFHMVYIGAGQTSFHVQNTKELQDRKFVENFKVSEIVLLSKQDSIVANHFGIYGQKIGFNPVPERKSYNELPKTSKPVYVGRFNSSLKGTDRLLIIAKTLKSIGEQGITIYTTTQGGAKEEIDKFLEQAQNEGISDFFDFKLDRTNTDEFFSNASYLIQPSRLESFGVSIIQSFSYGIPVLSSSYAAGPSEIINHKNNGWLCDTYSPDEITKAHTYIMENMETMRSNAFEAHKKYSFSRYFTFTEQISEELLNSKEERNSKQVLPWIKPRKQPFNHPTLAQRISKKLFKIFRK